jgi:hypothetical protein
MDPIPQTLLITMDPMDLVDFLAAVVAVVAAVVDLLVVAVVAAVVDLLVVVAVVDLLTTPTTTLTLRIAVSHFPRSRSNLGKV